MEKKITPHTTKGLLLALLLIIIDIVASIAGIKFETWFRWLPTLIFLAVIIWACINYANQMDNQLTFGNLFVHGFKTSAVVASIMVIYTVLSLYVIFPEQIEQGLEMARQQMEEKNIPQANIDQGLELARKFNVPFAIMGAIFGTLIVGAIGSLIGGAIAKKNPPSPFQEQV
jgi:hypothetical protein